MFRLLWHLRHLRHLKLHIQIQLYLIMPKLVHLITVQEAHKELNILIDQIRAKYELLDSAECGKVGIPAFDAECSELGHLMALMSKLCRHLNLLMPKDLHRSLPLQTLKSIKLEIYFFLAGSVRIWRVQLCS